MRAQTFIVYFSAAGTTRRVAETIAAGMRRNGAVPTVLDLAAQPDQSAIMAAIRDAGEEAVVFVGSPVYRDLAAEPVMRFIEALPEGEERGAVPFVTWGAACSGVALWQMGDALLARGWRVVAAAKVLAQHSLMWRSADAPGKGHPDGADDLLIAQLVDNVCARLHSGSIPPLSLDALDYHPAGRSSQMRKKIGSPRQIVPKKADQSRCSQCGDCVAACPAAAVTLAPFPEFTTDCLDCFNCIRLCPEEAITPAVDLAQIENHIRERVRTIDERPPSQIFLP